MRTIVPAKLEHGRVRHGYYASTPADGLVGAFLVMGPKDERLKILSSGVDDANGWEHVSVSTERRTPNWAEMAFVKDLFWRDDECVLQFHPPKAEYINHHPYCLHLWRSLRHEMPRPPWRLVGPKTEASA